MRTADIVDSVNHLIEACKDAEQEFVHYAGYVDNGEVGDFLWARAQSLRAATGELSALVSDLGGKPRETGTPRAALQRGWGSQFNPGGGPDDPTMLEYCERAEVAALERYGDLLDEWISPRMRNVVQRQYAAADRSHQTLGAIRYQEQMESV